MNYADLVTEVKVWVRAPSMDAAVRSAVRAVTLGYHRRDKFWRDLATVSLVGLPRDFIQVIDIASSLPFFRQLQSVEGCKLVEFDDLTDADGLARTNIALLAGTNLNVKRNVEVTGFNVTYYRDPDVTELGWNSWIAETQPDLIICGAAARALAWNAESEIYQAAKAEEAAQWRELRMNNIEGVGR